MGSRAPPESSAGINVSDTLILSNDTLLPGDQDFPGPGIPQAIAVDPLAGELVVDFPGEIEIISIATAHVVTTIRNLTSSGSLAYDDATNDLWLAETETNDLTVLSLVNDSVVANLSLGVSPGDLLYDGESGEMFVSEPASGDVLVLNGTTRATVATVSGFSGPSVMAANDVGGEVYVAEQPDLIGVISESSNRITANATLPFSPDSLAFDGPRDELFVPNPAAREVNGPENVTSNITILSGVNYSVLAHVATYGELGAVVFDNRTGDLYVADPYFHDVEVISDSSDTVVANVSALPGPEEMAFDGSLGEVFVVNPEPETISFVSDSTFSVSDTYVIQASPAGSAYDNATGDLLVADLYANSLLEVSTSNNSVVGTLPTGFEPYAVLYDPHSGQTFVADLGGSEVTVLSGSTGDLVATIPVGSEPAGFALDSHLGEVFVVNYASDNVSVISTGSDQVISTISLGGSPDSTVFDPLNGLVYAAVILRIGLPNGGGTVAEISPTTESVVGNVSGIGPSPWGFAFDSATGDLYVGNISYSPGGLVNLTVFSGATNDVVANVAWPSPAQSLTFVNTTEQILVTSQPYDAVGAISDATESFVGGVEVGNDPISLTWVSGANATYVSNIEGGTLSILSPGSTDQPVTYPVTVSESGLATGFRWSVTDNGTTWFSNTTSLTIPASNGSFNWEAHSAGDLYQPSPGKGTFTIMGAGGSLNLSFVLVTYPVQFFERGLPTGDTWSVALDGTVRSGNATELDFQEPNGTFLFSTSSSDSPYAPSPRNGSVSVMGRSASESIEFQIADYTLSFHETGLPPGGPWSVSILDASVLGYLPTLTLSFPNGTYTVLIGPVGPYLPAYNSRLVVNGTNLTVPVDFEVSYPVTFLESSLPSGTNWSVTVNSTSHSSTRSTIVFNETNGTYFFLVGHPSSVSATPGSGLLVLDGHGANESIDFAPIVFPVAFSESGLPAGTEWSVVLNGTNHSSTSDIITFLEFNGTFGYSIAAAAGYNCSRPNGTVLVAGQPVAFAVAFTSNLRSPPPPGSSGMPGGSWDWTLAGVGILVVGSAVGGLVVLRRRREPQPHPPRLTRAEPAIAVSEEPRPGSADSSFAERWNRPK